jgi:hypothetical protein
MGRADVAQTLRSRMGYGPYPLYLPHLRTGISVSPCICLTCKKCVFFVPECDVHVVLTKSRFPRQALRPLNAEGPGLGDRGLRRIQPTTRVAG